jgi:hypothetical protein
MSGPFAQFAERALLALLGFTVVGLSLWLVVRYLSGASLR